MPKPAASSAELGEVLRRTVDAAEAERRDVGADEDPRRPELVHQLELAPRPVEPAGALRLGHALEVPERLEGDDLEAVVAHHPADLGRRAVRGEHVGLEDLDALEAGGGDRRQLLGEAAAERDGGDREPHASSLATARAAPRASRPGAGKPKNSR